MTRKEIIELRDRSFDALQSKLPARGDERSITHYFLPFVDLMAAVHATCCRQLDSMCIEFLDSGERDELRRIADSLELLHLELPEQRDFILATIEELRVIAARGGES